MGISSCLLGNEVRWNGGHKLDKYLTRTLGQFVEYVPVCPEVEAGLSIPRPPVQLTGSIETPRLTGRDDPSLDVTDIMQKYCNTRPAELNQLSGFIFKSRSPSCGLNSTPVFINGSCVTENGRGIFAASLCKAYPELPVIEDIDLDDQNKLDKFIQLTESANKNIL